jgi:hypothetical protein
MLRGTAESLCLALGKLMGTCKLSWITEPHGLLAVNAEAALCEVGSRSKFGVTSHGGLRKEKSTRKRLRTGASDHESTGPHPYEGNRLAEATGVILLRRGLVSRHV